MGLFGKKKDDEAPAAPQQQSVEQMMAGYDPAAAQRAMQQAEQALGSVATMRGFGGADVEARIAAAQANLAQSQGVMDQYAQLGGGAAVGSPSWLDAVLHPQSDFIRQCSCEQCGGQKKLPSPTAYLYCDYCSALVDYDFRAVVRGAAATSTTPDLAYVQSVNQLAQDKRAAKAAGDKAAFERLERQFFDSWITSSPQAVSHRCGDPAYRAAYVDYCVANSMATAFDPQMAATEAELTEAVKSMVYGGQGLGMMQINPDSFWPILDVVMRQQQYSLDATAKAGVRDLDPDHAPEPVRRRMGISTMVQGWMPYLSADAGEEMLRRTGLAGEYKHVEPVVDGATRHCGQCGQEFVALPGAKSTVCTSCGHKLDVGSAEWPCSNCGGLVTLPAGASNTTCPYCKGLVERVGR